MVNVHSIKMEDFLAAKCTAACWNVGPRPALQPSGANIAYWSLLRGKSGPPTGSFAPPEPPMRTCLDMEDSCYAVVIERPRELPANTAIFDMTVN